jgi:hypothetical protein
MTIARTTKKPAVISKRKKIWTLLHSPKRVNNHKEENVCLQDLCISCVGCYVIRCCECNRWSLSRAMVSRVLLKRAKKISAIVSLSFLLLLIVCNCCAKLLIDLYFVLEINPPCKQISKSKKSNITSMKNVNNQFHTNYNTRLHKFAP